MALKERNERYKRIREDLTLYVRQELIHTDDGIGTLRNLLFRNRYRQVGEIGISRIRTFTFSSDSASDSIACLRSNVNWLIGIRSASTEKNQPIT